MLKFARWLSIEDSWHYYRKEVWFLREVLLHMDPKETQKLVEAASTQLLDAELAEKLTTDKGGLIARAPTYITEEMIDTLDSFVSVTEPLRQLYKKRATDVKTPADCLKNDLMLIKGGWEHEFRDVMRAGCFNMHNLRTIGAFGGDARAKENCTSQVAFVLEVWTQRAMRVMPTVLEYPNIVAECLDTDDPAGAKLSIKDAAAHLRILLEWEHAVEAGSDLDAHIVLDLIWWREHKLIRLFFAFGSSGGGP